MKQKNMKQKDTRTREQRAEDLMKVLTWCIVNNIKKHYQTVEKFKTAYFQMKTGHMSYEEQIDFCHRFEFESSIIRKIIGREDGKWVKLSEVKPFFADWFHYQPQFTKQYKSGKSYAVHSYWYLDFDMIDRCLKDQKVLDCRSDFYTKTQYVLINRIFLADKTTKTMTITETNAKKPVADCAELQSNNTLKTTQNTHEVTSCDPATVSQQTDDDIVSDPDEIIPRWHRRFQNAVIACVLPCRIAEECMFMLGDNTGFRDPHGFSTLDEKRHYKEAISLLVKFKTSFPAMTNQNNHGKNAWMIVDKYINSLRRFE